MKQTKRKVRNVLRNRPLWTFAEIAAAAGITDRHLRRLEMQDPEIGLAYGKSLLAKLQAETAQFGQLVSQRQFGQPLNRQGWEVEKLARLIKAWEARHGRKLD